MTEYESYIVGQDDFYKSIIEWFELKSTKPKCECQDVRRQSDARKKREAFRMVWREFEEEFKDE